MRRTRQEITMKGQKNAFSTDGHREMRDVIYAPDRSSYQHSFSLNNVTCNRALVRSKCF
jgi:hypothetical protein